MNNNSRILEFEEYELIHKSSKNTPLGYKLVPKSSKNAIDLKRRHIYIVLFKDEIIYVGEAKSSLKTRFDRSFVSYRHYKRTGKARGGYKGHKWIELLENKKNELTVHAIIFDKTFDPDKKRAEIEAIEGEIVYAVRNKTGKWPQYQNEIHFQNKPGAKEMAEYILNNII